MAYPRAGSQNYMMSLAHVVMIENKEVLKKQKDGGM